MVMIEARYPALAGLENPRYNAALCGSKLSDGRRLEKRRVAGPRRKIWDWKGRDLRNCSHGKKKPACRFELRELARRRRNPRGGDRGCDQSGDCTPACPGPTKRKHHASSRTIHSVIERCRGAQPRISVAAVLRTRLLEPSENVAFSRPQASIAASAGQDCAAPRPSFTAMASTTFPSASSPLST